MPWLVLDEDSQWRSAGFNFGAFNFLLGINVESWVGDLCVCFLSRSRDINPHISENRWRTQSVVAESMTPRHRGNTSALKSDETEILVWGPKPHWTSLPQLSQLIWLMLPLKLSYFVITHQGARTDPIILFDISIKNSDDTPLEKLGQVGICVLV